MLWLPTFINERLNRAILLCTMSECHYNHYTACCFNQIPPCRQYLYIYTIVNTNDNCYWCRTFIFCLLCPFSLVYCTIFNHCIVLLNYADEVRNFYLYFFN